MLSITVVGEDSPDVVKNVIPYFRKKPFKLDDVYIAMLVINAGVYPTHNYNFKFWETDCLYRKEYIAQQCCLFLPVIFV